jgi:hypothetical protein
MVRCVTRFPAAGEIRELLGRSQQRLEQLRRKHPDWRIWNVPRANGPTTWHAEPRRYPLNAHTADELADSIAEDEAPPTEGLHTSPGC